MRITPPHILAATAAIIIVPVIVTIALGGDLRDLPLGAMAVAVLAGLFIARRAAGRRTVDDMPPDEDPNTD